MNAFSNFLYKTDRSKTTLLIRVMIGAVFLSEGIQKFLFPELVGEGRFTKIGFMHAEFWATFTACFEILCGSLVLLGLFTRLAVVPLLIIMGVAFVKTKFPILMNKGLWTMAHEYRTDFCMTIGTVFLLLKGAGSISLDSILDKSSSWKEKAGNLKEVAKLFLKLGLIGFGGPMVHLALMEEEVVRKRKWFSQEHFMDLVGVTNLIPGPNSTEMTMHCGQERAGRAGLIIAGLCFILPAAIITGILAWAYQLYGRLPEVQPFISGIQPAIIAILVSLMISLGKKALKTVELGIIGTLAVVLALYGISEIFILFGGGFTGMIWYFLKNRKGNLKSIVPFVAFSHCNTSDLKLFLIFLKIGSILYGSGYVLFAFLDEEFVKTGMLSKQELIDAIAVGQFTPGPVFSSATFIGWQIGGLPAAILATVGIFLPSFLFVAFLNSLLPALRKSKWMSVFLDTVNIVSIALILSICVEMATAAISDWRSSIIALSGFAVSMAFKKLNSAWIILGGAGLGYLLNAFV